MQTATTPMPGMADEHGHATRLALRLALRLHARGLAADHVAASRCALSVSSFQTIAGWSVGAIAGADRGITLPAFRLRPGAVAADDFFRT